jgi:hypothetical protein
VMALGHGVILTHHGIRATGFAGAGRAPWVRA